MEYYSINMDTLNNSKITYKYTLNNSNVNKYNNIEIMDIESRSNPNYYKEFAVCINKSFEYINKLIDNNNEIQFLVKCSTYDNMYKLYYLDNKKKEKKGNKIQIIVKDIINYNPNYNPNYNIHKDTSKMFKMKLINYNEFFESDWNYFYRKNGYIIKKNFTCYKITYIIMILILGVFIFACINMNNTYHVNIDDTNPIEYKYKFKYINYNYLKIINNCSCIINKYKDIDKYGNYINKTNFKLNCNSIYNNDYINKKIDNINYTQFCNINNIKNLDFINVNSTFINKLSYCNSLLNTKFIPLFKIDQNKKFICNVTESIILFIIPLLLIIIYIAMCCGTLIFAY